MANIANAMKPSGKKLENEPDALLLLRLHNPDHAQRPVPLAFMLVISTADTTASPMATSYDTICALERSAPISG